MNPIPLGIYRHYKGNHYEVVGFARHSETLEDMVIYKALYGENATWVRPLSMWDDLIEVGGRTVKRFEYVMTAHASKILSDELTLRLIETHPASEEMPPWNYYDIIENTTGEVAGKISARLGDNAHSYYNGHIGFEIDLHKRGHGYAAKATQLLLPIFRAHGLERIYLTCAESNISSRRSIESIGAGLVELAEVPAWCFFWREGMERYCIYHLDLEG